MSSKIIYKLAIIAAFSSFVACTHFSNKTDNSSATRTTANDELADGDSESLADSNDETFDSSASTAELADIQGAVSARLRNMADASYQFIYIDSDGKATVLAELNKTKQFVPGSLAKMFYGYYFHKNKLYSDNEITYMLKGGPDLQLYANEGKVVNDVKKFYSKFNQTNQYSLNELSQASRQNHLSAEVMNNFLKNVYRDQGAYNQFKSMLPNPGGRPNNFIIKSLSSLGDRLHAKASTFPRRGELASAGYVDVSTKNGNGVIIYTMYGVQRGDSESRFAGKAKMASVIKLLTDYVDSQNN